MKNLALILSLVMLSATISSAGHKGWSWGWWMPKPPKQWEKPERPEKPEGEDQEKPERPERPEAPEAEEQERPERPESPEAPEGEEGKVFGNGNLPEFFPNPYRTYSDCKTLLAEPSENPHRTLTAFSQNP